MNSQNANNDEANNLKQLEQEAKSILESGNQLAYLSRKINTFIMFKKNEHHLMKVAYICPHCSHSETAELELSKPYTLNCSACNHEIFKQEKIKVKSIRAKST